MKIFLIICFFFLITNCGKPKTVLICGDHVCVNKSEAKLYFEENLSIEVKIIDKNKKENLDLVELNLKTNNNRAREVTIVQKPNTNEIVKILSNDEIKKIKKEIKKKKKIVKLIEGKTGKKNINKPISSNQDIFQKKGNNIKKNINKQRTKVVDVCTIIKKCNIDEISKYLLKEAKGKKFPNLTIRE